MDEVISDICGDRRLRRRYEIDLRVQYKVMRHDQWPKRGSGKTINLSGAGIACEFDQVLKPGSARRGSLRLRGRIAEQRLSPENGGYRKSDPQRRGVDRGSHGEIRIQDPGSEDDACLRRAWDP